MYKNGDTYICVIGNGVFSKGEIVKILKIRDEVVFFDDIKETSKFHFIRTFYDFNRYFKRCRVKMSYAIWERTYCKCTT
jgi:hypothetical protein